MRIVTDRFNRAIHGMLRVLVIGLLGVASILSVASLRAQEGHPHPGAESGPEDARVLPVGSVRVRASAPPASLTLSTGDRDPEGLEPGTVHSSPGGMIFDGPVHLDLGMDASLRVEEGAQVRIEAGRIPGSLRMDVRQGTAEGISGKVRMRLQAPGRFVSMAGVGFFDVSGNGALLQDGEPLAFRGKGAIEELLDAFQRISIHEDRFAPVHGAYLFDPRVDLPPRDDFDRVISGSKAFR